MLNDLNKFARYAMRHVIATAIVVSALASAFVYLAAQYKDLSTAKDDLAAKQKAFDEQRVQYEHRQREEERALLIQKSELDKREFEMAHREAQFKESSTALQERGADYAAAELRLRATAESVSTKLRLKEDEERMRKAINEFSAYGVDLNHAPPCEPTGRQRYEAAAAKYREAQALADASGLRKKYDKFLSQWWIISTPQCN